MNVELKWLCYTALLAASLWMPYVIGVNTTEFTGKKELLIRPPDHSKMQPWVHRSLRAQQNMLEQLLPFAVLVLIGAVAKISTPVTVACAVSFFWLRVAHAIGMVSGLARLPLRPLLYVSGWIVTLVYAAQILDA